MAGKFGNWLSYQYRHLSPQEFQLWAQTQRAQDPGKGAAIDAYVDRQGKMPAVQRRLEDLKREILKKIMAPAVERATKRLAEMEKQSAPDRSGLLRQALGATKGKTYLEKLTAWSAVGPRRGYGRILLARMTTKGVRVRRTSKKFTEENTLSTYANPVKYAHLVRGGRKAIVALGKKALYDKFTGRFFGHSVKAAAPHDFAASAIAQAPSAAQEATQEMAAGVQSLAQ